MQVEMWKTSQVKPYGKNPRRNDGAVDAVAASIREFGFKQPIVVDRDGIIIAGHTRHKAAKKLGLKEVPVVVADDLPPEKVKAYRLADNKVGELAGWDFSPLDRELAELDDLDFDLSEFGFGIGSDKYTLVPYMYDELDMDDRFQCAFTNTHMKAALIHSRKGTHYTLTGSANLRSSSSLEQFDLEEGAERYHFFHDALSSLVEKYATINYKKPKIERGFKSWQAVREKLQ